VYDYRVMEDRRIGRPVFVPSHLLEHQIMKTNHGNSAAGVIEHVDQRRRRFLGKLFARGAAVAALPAMATIAFGEEKAGGAAKTKGGPSKGKAGGAAPDPAALAARLIHEFDKDGDKALNHAELAAALKVLQARGRRGRGQGGVGGQASSTGQRAGGRGRGGRKGKGQG
jgi:hypothetical protein